MQTNYNNLFKMVIGFIIDRLSIISVSLFIAFVLSTCHDERVVPSYEDAAQSVSEHRRGKSDHVDPFADLVVEDGVIDEGQCCQNPARLIGPWILLDAREPWASVQLGLNGYVVMDMGAGEEIVQGKGPDLMVVEYDGTLLSGGVNGAAEPYSVWVSNAPTGPFVSLGEATGTGFFELAGKGLSSARYVKIQAEGGPWRGADIQSLVAMNMAGARFEMIPHIIKRGQGRPLMARFQFREHIDVASVSIVVVASIGQLPPTDEVPYTTDLNIEGRLHRNGTFIQFNRGEFLEAATDGENLVVALKVITRSGEVRYLFDLVSVVSHRTRL